MRAHFYAAIAFAAIAADDTAMTMTRAVRLTSASQYSMAHTIASLSSPSFNPFDMVFPDLGAQIESAEGDQDGGSDEADLKEGVEKVLSKDDLEKQGWPEGVAVTKVKGDYPKEPEWPQDPEETTVVKYETTTNSNIEMPEGSGASSLTKVVSKAREIDPNIFTRVRLGSKSSEEQAKEEKEKAEIARAKGGTQETAIKAKEKEEARQKEEIGHLMDEAKLKAQEEEARKEAKKREEKQKQEQKDREAEREVDQAPTKAMLENIEHQLHEQSQETKKTLHKMQENQDEIQALLKNDAAPPKQPKEKPESNKPQEGDKKEDSKKEDPKKEDPKKDEPQSDAKSEPKKEDAK